MNIWFKTAIAALLVAQVWASEKKDFFGFWIPDMEKSMETMTDKEKAEIKELPQVMTQMLESIVIEIQDGQVTAWMMGQKETTTCSVFTVKDETLSATCTNPRNGKGQSVQAKVSGTHLLISRSQSGPGQQVNEMAFKSVSQAEAMKTASKAPSEEEFMKFFMQMMQESMLQEMQNPKSSVPSKK